MSKPKTMGRREKARGRPYRDPLPVILIVCEGEETEPNYFTAYKKRITTVRIEPQGEGYNTVSLVNRADALIAKVMEQAGVRRHQVEVWCVFDCDEYQQQFDEAVALARKKGYNSAESNECFELWFLLHFAYHQAAWTREQYKAALDDQMKKLGHEGYEKNSTFMYDWLLDRQQTAMRNAERLILKMTPGKPLHLSTPYTNVHRLVERLNALI